MADQAVKKYLSIGTTFDPCYLLLDSTFKSNKSGCTAQILSNTSFQVLDMLYYRAGNNDSQPGVQYVKQACARKNRHL